jgi:hypothetical protein
LVFTSPRLRAEVKPQHHPPAQLRDLAARFALNVSA